MTARRGPELRFRRIDQLRGLAALAVVLCHAAVSSEAVVQNPTEQPGHGLAALLGWGYLGVPLFFVISGLCIHLPAAAALAADPRARPDWSRFFQRRFWRLYPSYLAALAIAAVQLFVATGGLPLGWRGVLAQALLVQTFHPATFDGLNPPAWTLAVEAQLYLAYPLVLVLLARLGTWRGLGVILVVTLLYRLSLDFGAVAAPFGGVAWEFFLARWFEWTLGAVVAAWAVGAVRLPRVASSPWLAAAALALAVRSEWEMWRAHLYVIKEPFYGVAFALVVLAALDRERRSGRVATTRVGRYLADVGVFSYSLYLLHRPIQLAVEPLARALANGPQVGGAGASRLPVSLLVMAATIPVTVWAARLFHRVCEEPCMRIAARVGRKARPAPASVAPAVGQPAA